MVYTILYVIRRFLSILPVTSHSLLLSILKLFAFCINYYLPFYIPSSCHRPSVVNIVLLTTSNYISIDHSSRDRDGREGRDRTRTGSSVNVGRPCARDPRGEEKLGTIPYTRRSSPSSSSSSTSYRDAGNKFPGLSLPINPPRMRDGREHPARSARN